MSTGRSPLPRVNNDWNRLGTRQSNDCQRSSTHRRSEPPSQQHLRNHRWIPSVSHSRSIGRKSGGCALSPKRELAAPEMDGSRNPPVWHNSTGHGGPTKSRLSSHATENVKINIIQNPCPFFLFFQLLENQYQSKIKILFRNTAPSKQSTQVCTLFSLFLAKQWKLNDS